jgi:hypothetical protein
MNPDVIPVIVGLPLALLAGSYAIYRVARLAWAVTRGPYETPSVTHVDNCGPCSGGQPFTGTHRGTITAHRSAVTDFDQALQAAGRRLNERENVSVE